MFKPNSYFAMTVFVLGTALTGFLGAVTTDFQGHHQTAHSIYELKGVSDFEGDFLFSIYEKRNHTRKWVRLNQTFNGLTITSYDSDRLIASATINGKQFALPLAKADAEFSSPVLISYHSTSVEDSIPNENAASGSVRTGLSDGPRNRALQTINDPNSSVEQRQAAALNFARLEQIAKKTTPDDPQSAVPPELNTELGLEVNMSKMRRYNPRLAAAYDKLEDQ